MNSERIATFVSILGVVLTTASVIASVAQYRAADLQAQAALVALMPQIEVRTLLEKVDSEKYTDRRIEISSDGGPIYNLNIDRQTWFEFRVGRKVVFQQPLSGYYFAEYPTGRTKGEVLKIGGHKNHDAYLAFARWSRDEFGSGVDMSEPITLLRISYRDALKRDNVEFVKVNGGNETYLSQDDGLDLWQQQSGIAKTNRSVDIDSLVSPQSATEWVKAWKKKIGVPAQ